jgi:predicted dehydrogenase
VSDRIRAGIVGVGHLGVLHAAKYADSGAAELAAVFDVDAARARDVAARHGCRAAASLDELLDAVDAVSIAVPAGAHAEVGLRAAAAGVHMLVEKPLAADSMSARALVDCAHAAGVVLQVGHLERFNPVFADLHRLVDRPRFVECHRLSQFAGRGVDTNVVFDVMIHDLDIIAYLVGEPLARVEAVGVPVLSREVDIANARMRFRGGCIANVTASRVSFKRERKLRVFQEDAYVSVDFDARNAVVARRVRERAAGGVDGAANIEIETRSFAEADPLRAEIEAFLACVRTGAPPVVSGEDGLVALAIADAVLAALETPAEAR